MRLDTYALTFRLGSRIVQLSDRAPVAYGPGAAFFWLFLRISDYDTLCHT